jgi:hypothetical protein
MIYPPFVIVFASLSRFSDLELPAFKKISRNHVLSEPEKGDGKRWF